MALNITPTGNYTDDVDLAKGSEVLSDLNLICDELIKPENLEDASVDVTAQAATFNPSTLPINDREETQSLRYQILQILDPNGTWIDSPLSYINELFAGKHKLVSKTTTYIVLSSDGVILCDSSSAAFTVTLPTAVSITGKFYMVKKTDTSSNAVTIDGNAAETIDGLLTQQLRTQNDFIILYSDGSNWAVLGKSQPRRLPQHKNLRILVNSTNPVYQLDTDADILDLLDSNNNLTRRFSFNQTSDITAVGAGGLDVGSEANSTIYAQWAIYDPINDQDAAMLSLSFTSPTMPTNYTYKRLVGFVVNDSSGNFISFYQTNDILLFDDPKTATQVLTTGGATTFTDVDCSNFAGNSVLVKEGLIGIEGYTTTDGSSYYCYVRRNGSSANPGKMVVRLRKDIGGGNYGQYQANEFWIPFDSSLIFEYDTTSGLTTNMWLHGVKLTL